jgi:hypothetical protein
MDRNFGYLLMMSWWLLMPAWLWAQRDATILDHKDRIRISRLDLLNSPAREVNLSITPDGNTLYFMSLRGGQHWSRSDYMTFRGDTVYDGDIWYAEKINGQWQRPRCLPLGINSSGGEDEPNVSSSGKSVYFQSWNRLWEYTGGPYYRATRSGNNWGKPEGLAGGITEFFRFVRATDGMTISPDEKKMIVAAGPDYDVNMDIYMSKKSSYGWTYCKRLPISTPGDDRSVFLAADGKTLYFASDGYEGFGGLDIFKTTLNSDGTFGEVINVGAPFNTPQDDYGLILTGNGLEAYFIRNGDIHFADLRDADARIRPVIPEVAHTLAGTVRDSINWRGVPAKIILFDARSKVPLQTIQTSTSGSYAITLPNQNKIYDQVVIAEGYPKVRRRISVVQSTYDETIASNFILAKPQAPKPLPPPIAANTPPPTPTRPQPQPTPQPKPEPSPVEEARSPVAVQPVLPKPDPKLPIQPIEQPKPAPIEVPEDPYSFEFVAENNLTLLLDVSASMKKPDKLPLLKDALAKLLEHMRVEDQISIIVYSGDVNIVLDGVSAAQRTLIMETIENLRSSGATKGKSALRKAYRLAERNFVSGGNNRIILATDGYFDVEDLYNIAESRGGNNISLSVFSFGKLKEELHQVLSDLASRGNGNYANITRENIDMALLREAKAVRR